MYLNILNTAFFGFFECWKSSWK